MMKLIAIVGLGYAGIVGALYFAQTWLLFPGASLPSQRLDRPRAPERLELASGDGATLHGMLFRVDRDADLLIGFGGNAQDAEFLAQALAADFPDLHVGVFHYRGYGPSTGRPSEAALLADALTVHDALIERLRPRRTYAVGVSLGSAVAAYLSKQRPIAGIVLITPFDSIEAIAKASYFWVPVGLLLRHRFRTVEFMAENPTPVAVIAAEHDRVVAPERTQALVRRLRNLVFHEVLGGARHSTLYELPAYERALEEALAAVRRAAAEA
jgi:alpha-beta hydrolase superfamily lysophospholipase